MKNRCFATLLLCGTALGCAGPALAQSAPAGRGDDAAAREAALEARLERLEAEVTELRSDLASERAKNARIAEAVQDQVAQNQGGQHQDGQSQRGSAPSVLTSTTGTVIAATDSDQSSNPPPATSPVPSYRGTTVKLGGWIKMEAAHSRFSSGDLATNSLGRDFYLPQQIPIGGPAREYTDFSAKQTRLWLNLETRIAGHVVKGYLETDFQTSPGTQGSQRTTNGYNLALRRAYLQVGRFTIGQEWSTFDNPLMLPETTDYVGGVEGFIFVRQPQIRYSQPLTKELTLHLAVENPETASATVGNAALVENGTDHLPDFAAKLEYTGRRGEMSLAGLARQVRVETGADVATSFGWGISTAGRLWLNQSKSADLRYMITYGRDISRYLGLNFAPDAVFVPGTAGGVTGSGAAALGDVRAFGAIVALHLPLGGSFRTNLMGSYQYDAYGSNLTLAQINSFNQRAWSGAANLFWSPMKPVDIGIEYRHGERMLVSGAQGRLDRLEFSAKYNF